MDAFHLFIVQIVHVVHFEIKIYIEINNSNKRMVEPQKS